MTREDETVTGLSDEDFKQAGVVVISNSAAAESAFGIPPGEHTYFTSYKEMQQASKSAAERAAEKGPEQEAPHPNFSDGTYQVGTDIQPGTYRTREGSPNCYWERLRNFSGGLNGILANGNTSAPAVVTIEQTDAGFHSEGCGTPCRPRACPGRRRGSGPAGARGGG